MSHLKKLEGRATLIVDGAEVGKVAYSISIFEDRGMKKAEGRISGTHELLMRTFQGRAASLIRENGDLIEIGVQRYRLSNDWAEIAVLNGDGL